MARLRAQVMTGEWAEVVRDRLVSAWQRFRESRLYVQTVCTAALFGAACLVHLLPYGPLARVAEAVEWTVAQDYDFRSRAADLQAWARGQGGWGPALTDLWRRGADVVRHWIGPVGSAGTGPAEPVGQPGASGEGPAGTAAGSPTLPQLPLKPVAGSVLREFGWYPAGAGERFHEGLDFLASQGTPVVAVRDGTVVAVRHDPNLGTVVEVRHGDVIAVYAHVEAVAVRAGDEVRRGQTLGVVAPALPAEQESPSHLHVEIRPVGTGEPVDPASYLGLGGKQL